MDNLVEFDWQIPSCTPCEKLEADVYDWYERHDSKCAEAKAHRYDIVMMGDSITHFWETTHGPEAWKALFRDRDVLNLGFGWDRTCNLLWRLDHGEFENQAPKVCVIHIGTNNLATTEHYQGDTPEDIAKGIQAVVAKIRMKSPSTMIVVMKVFPRGLKTDPLQAKIDKVNELLEKWHYFHPEIRLLDISHQLMSDGQINQQLYRDGTHINELGYLVWGAALEQVFRDAKL